MQTIKPLSMTLMARPAELGQRKGLIVAAQLGLDVSSKVDLFSEQSLWNFLSEEPSAPIIDEGSPKQTPEFLVHGYAYPNPEQSNASNAVAVRARLGSIRKTVLAFGNRYWDGDKISDPQAFERIPLDWRHAYGGPDFPINPQGMGRETLNGVCRLPNVELRSSRVQKKNEPVVPAGFGPLEVMHPQRQKFAGTYDENWLKDHAPSPPPDFESQHYNMAPRDQWFDAPLVGDEPYELENMHPEKPLIRGQLPGLRVRVFARFKADAEDQYAAEMKMREVNMNLTTVWFFPHAEKIILIFNGLLPIHTDDGSDVSGLLAAVERIGEPKSDAHYADVLLKRTEGEDTDLESLNDAPLLPEGITVENPIQDAVDAELEVGGKREENQLRRAQVEALIARDKLKAAGQDPEQIKMPEREPPPKPEELVEKVREARKQGEAAQVKALENALDQVIAALEFRKKHKIDPAELVHRGPPKYSADAELKKIDAIYAKASKSFDRKPVEEKFKLIEQNHRRTYLKFAHEQPHAFPLTGEEARLRRAEMEFVVEKQLKFLPTFDLTGVDLSNLDLRGINFTGAWLESVNLDGANITRCDFTGAVLAHASLRGTIAIGTNFTEANLGQATFIDAQLSEANFTKATMMKSRLRGCDLSEATFSETLLLESTWDAVDFSQADVSGQFFHQLHMKDCVFEQAHIASATFNECDLRTVDFREAQGEAVSFVNCDLEDGALQLAKLKGAVFAMGSKLGGANFAGADLSSANFHDCDLSRVNLRQATLDQCNLSGACMAGSDARLATARGALMTKVDVSGGRWVGVDFKDAILTGIDLRGTDIRHAHLFGADLSKARLDDKTLTDGLNLEGARIHPRYRPPEDEAANA